MSASREGGRAPVRGTAPPHAVVVSGIGTRTAERQQLYRENERARASGERLGSDRVDGSTSIAELGLEQGTISRLRRRGITRIATLLECSVEDLWRGIGRHGIANILERLAHHGIPFRPLSDYAKWRLGLLSPQQAGVDAAPDTPVADLWPRLGRALVEALEARGPKTLIELSPVDDDGLRLLYRLGRANLQRVRVLLESALAHADAQETAVLQAGIARIEDIENAGRQARRGRADAASRSASTDGGRTDRQAADRPLRPASRAGTA